MMEEKISEYEMMLRGIIEKIDGYMKCLQIIQENYKKQIVDRNVYLHGQLLMVCQLMEYDRRQISYILDEKKKIHISK